MLTSLTTPPILKPEPHTDEPDSNTDDPGPSPSAYVFRIQTRQSPYLDTFHAHHPVHITIASGATGNMIHHTDVQSLSCHVRPSSQSVHQADGSSPLHMVGETCLSFTHEDQTFTFEGLVVENLDVDVLAGTPFMGTNDIAVRPAKRQVILGDGSIHHYGSHQPAAVSSATRRAIVLRSPPSLTTIWLGEFLGVDLRVMHLVTLYMHWNHKPTRLAQDSYQPPKCGQPWPSSPALQVRYTSPTCLPSHISSRETSTSVRYVPCMHQKPATTTHNCKPRDNPGHLYFRPTRTGTRTL